MCIHRTISQSILLVPCGTSSLRRDLTGHDMTWHDDFINCYIKNIFTAWTKCVVLVFDNRRSHKKWRWWAKAGERSLLQQQLQQRSQASKEQECCYQSHFWYRLHPACRTSKWIRTVNKIKLSKLICYTKRWRAYAQNVISPNCKWKCE